MPARVINSSDSGQFDARQIVQRMGAMFDNPIAAVRIEFGPLSTTARDVTFTVVDRLENRYPPQSFLEPPKSSEGRWIIAVYVAESEYGTPITPGTFTASKGKVFGSVGPALYFIETAADGIAVVHVDKSVTLTYLHAGVVCLLRSRGIDWATGATTVPTPPGEPTKFET